MVGTDQKTTLELKLEKLRQICDKAPDHAIGLLALAETAFRRGLRLEALEAYQKVLKDESVAEAHLCMAQMYRQHGLFQEAIAELRTLFEIEPGYPEAHVFAKELAEETALPEDIQEVLQEGCGSDELALARVRLSIARSLVLREGQELVAIQDANANDPTFGYYIGETRKRLSYCEQVLSQLTSLEEARTAYLAEQERQRQLDSQRELQLRNELEVQGDGTAEEVVLSGPPPEVAAETVAPIEESAPVLQEESPPIEAAPGPELSEEESPGEAPALDIEAVEPAPALEPELEPEAEPELEAPSAAPELWDDGPRRALSLSEPVPLKEHDDRPAYHLPDAVLEPDLPDLQPDLPELEPDLPSPSAELPSVEPTEQPSALPMSSGLWDDVEPAAHSPQPSLSMDLPETEAALPEEEADYSTPDLELEASAEPEEEPIVEAEDAGEVDFETQYEPYLGNLENLIQTLAKTRGVSSVFLVNRHGYVVSSTAKDPLEPERVSEFIVETVAFLESFADHPQYWVLECAGGIVVIQSVDNYHFLVTIGQGGANFGALRYTMDRVRPSFEQVLQPLISTE